MRSFFKKALLALPVLGLAGISSAAVYNGNGNTGFGGTLGNGSLSITDSGGNVTFTFNPNGSFNSNDVVVYIDSQSGGFSDTSSFSDNGDAGRTSISGLSGNGRTLVTFAPGFTADFGLEFENNIFTGLFGLASGGNNSLNYVNGSTPTTGGPYTVTVTEAQLGLMPGQGFNFVATLISTDAYRSNETIGASDQTSSSSNPAYTGGVTFTGSQSFPVPEPASTTLVGVAAVAALRRRRAR